MSTSAGWIRSSRCGDGQCVEIRPDQHRVLVRDSKSPDTGHLAFEPRTWRSFMSGVRAGEFDLQ